MIFFQNEGVVPIAAFTTFGMSAKPGSTNPIGKFGTGLKNAVAIILRLGGTFRLFRGEEEYEFYTKAEEFRGQTFARVRMKRRRGILSKWTYEELPFTTELGKHWKPWMAVRELEANVRDEGGRSYQVDGEFFRKHGIATITAGRTVIVVECKEFEEAYLDLGSIFLPDDRQVMHSDDHVTVYEGESKYLFYRGMRITDLRRPTLYTYELKDVFLTEDRTSKYPFMDDIYIRDCLLRCRDSRIIHNVVHASKDYHEGTFAWDEQANLGGRASSSWGPVLRMAGVSGRFAVLRDNVAAGIRSDALVEVQLKVSEWEEILEKLGEGEGLGIRKALIKEGWRGSAFKQPEAVETVEASKDDLPF